MLLSYSRNDLSFALPEDSSGSVLGSRFTILIGSNGSGKSKILSDVSRSFIRYINLDKLDQQRPPKDGDDILPSEKTMRNLERVESLLAVSNLVTDSFPNSPRFGNRYKYLGLKRGMTMFSTGSVGLVMASSVADLLLKKDLHDATLEELERINIHNLKLSFSGRVIPNYEQKLIDYIEHVTGNRGLSSFRQKSGFEALRSNESKPVFIQELVNWVEMFSERASHSESIGQNALIEKLMLIARKFDLLPSNCLDVLRKCNIRAGVSVTKNKNEYKFDELSVGEQLMSSTLVRIVANISPNSVVLIDEPEVGLHPNWQQIFIPMLDSIIPDVYESHFIIATHSPFVVSEGTDILVPSNNWGSFVPYPDDISARSIDDILYRVFRARISGNSAVSKDVQMLLSHISGIHEFNEKDLLNAISRLSALSDSGTVELNQLLTSVKRIVGGESEAN